MSLLVELLDGPLDGQTISYDHLSDLPPFIPCVTDMSGCYWPAPIPHWRGMNMPLAYVWLVPFIEGEPCPLCNEPYFEEDPHEL